MLEKAKGDRKVSAEAKKKGKGHEKMSTMRDKDKEAKKAQQESERKVGKSKKND